MLLVVFGELFREVTSHTGMTNTLDPWLANAVAAHRLAWLARALSVLTWLGSSVFLIPLCIVVAGWLWRSHRTLRPAVNLALAIGGAAALYDLVKPLVGRMRPPAALQYGAPDTDFAFPSGHATQSASFYAMLVVVLTNWVWPHRRVLLSLVVALIVAIVAMARIYLGVHWLTDVLAGLALGLAWFSMLMALMAGASIPSSSRSPSTP
ncbi:MAG TPA: phosphatase PAP2 family protein [Candidatus Dormibacteraeota bacterium]|nr:phosphatase PAP2 family protein [Candidatus Dormibacteraeota bacterium]